MTESFQIKIWFFEFLFTTSLKSCIIFIFINLLPNIPHFCLFHRVIKTEPPKQNCDLPLMFYFFQCAHVLCSINQVCLMSLCFCYWCFVFNPTCMFLFIWLKCNQKSILFHFIFVYNTHSNYVSLLLWFECFMLFVFVIGTACVCVKWNLFFLYFFSYFTFF